MKNKKSGWKVFKKNWPLYVLLLPSFVSAVIFHYIPMSGIVMAFQDYKPWKGISGSDFVGLANFEQIFTYYDSKQAIINTLIISISKIILGIVVPVIFALLLNEIRTIGLKKGIQTLIYLPYFLSWIIVAGMMRDILGLDGLLNTVLENIGIEPIFFLGEDSLIRPVLVLSDLWKGFGFGTIVYLAAIANVDVAQYEAAEIDGATRWQQTMHITIPGISAIIIVMATLSLGNVLNAGFDQVFNLYSPLTYQSGDIIDTYVYRQSLLNGQYSIGTAVGLFKSGIGLILTIISYRLAYKFAGYKIF